MLELNFILLISFGLILITLTWSTSFGYRGDRLYSVGLLIPAIPLIAVSISSVNIFNTLVIQVYHSMHLTFEFVYSSYGIFSTLDN